MTIGHRWDDPDDSGEIPGMPGGRHRRPLARDTAGEVFDQHPPVSRPSMMSVRDHEMARMRAKLMNPATAYAELIESLNFAHTQGGKPPLDTLGKAVGYSKATLSRVLTGKAMPSWVLVRRLGVHVGVPPQVLQDWYTLWTAANMSRRKPTTVLGRAPVPSGSAPGTADATGTAAPDSTEAGFTCPTCGCWVNDTARHIGWHMQIDRSGRPAPAHESIDGWNVGSNEFKLLREALGDDNT